KLTDTLAPGLTIDSFDTGGFGNCTQSGQTLTCNFGTVATGDGGEVTIVATPTVAGDLTSTVDVTSTTTDPDPSNNHVTDTVTVNETPTADLVILKFGQPDPVSVGGDLAYTIDVQNFGPNDAPNTVVTDPLPGSVTFVSATSTLGTCSQAAGVVTCNLGT